MMKYFISIFLIFILSGCDDSLQQKSIAPKSTIIASESWENTAPINNQQRDLLWLYQYSLSVRCDLLKNKSYLQFTGKGSTTNFKVTQLLGTNKDGNQYSILTDGTNNFSELIQFFDEVTSFVIYGESDELPIKIEYLEGNAGSLKSRYECEKASLFTKETRYSFENSALKIIKDE